MDNITVKLVKFNGIQSLLLVTISTKWIIVVFSWLHRHTRVFSASSSTHTDVCPSIRRTSSRNTRESVELRCLPICSPLLITPTVVCLSVSHIISIVISLMIRSSQRFSTGSACKVVERRTSITTSDHNTTCHFRPSSIRRNLSGCEAKSAYY